MSCEIKLSKYREITIHKATFKLKYYKSTYIVCSFLVPRTVRKRREILEAMLYYKFD